MVRVQIRQILERSVDKLKRDAAQAMKMDLTGKPPPITLYSFDARRPPVETADFLAKGSDQDVGGYTTCGFTPVSSSSSSTPTPTSSTLPPPAENSPPATATAAATGEGPSYMAFHGNMSLKVPDDLLGKLRAGYAGMRNKRRITLFGEDMWDLGQYSHLRVTVAYRGWEGWRNRWYCNIQTDGPILTDLFQHRLELPPSPASTPSTAALDPLSGPPPTFTTLHLPLASFVLTNSGETSEHQMEMMYSRIRTVGFSLLGGGRGEEGMPSLAPPPSPARIAQMRRLAAAGYGDGGQSEDPDPIVEEMLAQDGIFLDKGKAKYVDPVKAAGYHRAGTDPSGVAQQQEEEDKTKVTPWSEGYFELCVKSIEAVNHDPLLDDDEGPESRDL